MKLCRKCGAKEGSDNCCENGALAKEEAPKKATKPRRSRQAPVQTEIVPDGAE